jgi:ATP-binding cassette, subfamily B, bacterial
MSIDPTLAAKVGTLTAPSQDSAVRTIGRGLETAPILRQGLGVTWMFAAVGAAGRVVVPILIQQAIDRGITPEGEVNVDVIVRMALLGALAVLVSGWAFRMASLRLGERSERALHDLRVRLIGHIHQLSLADHNDERRGGLVARVTSDIETLARFFQWGGLAWLVDGTLMVIVAGVMLAYDWVLALVAFAVAIPLLFVLRAVQSRLLVAYDRARHNNGQSLGAIAELVSGGPTVRAYGAGETMARQVEESVATTAAAQIRAALIGAFLFPSGEVFSAFTVSAVVGVGVWRGPESGLTAGALVGFVFLTYRFLEPIAEFTEVLDTTQMAVAGLRRVLSVLDMPIGPPQPGRPDPVAAGAAPDRHPRGHLCLPESERRVRRRRRAEEYRRDDPAGAAGGDGRCHRLRQDHAGSVDRPFRRSDDRRDRPRGVPLRRVDRSELRTRLIVVSQEPFLFDDTVAANIAFADERADQRDVERVVDELGVRDWVDSLSNGLGTNVGERGDQLSAGERQLVALLRAGLADPDILILDEATSSVDALTEVRIARALERLAASRTTIAIAHRLSTAARADRVLVLDHGRLVQDGHHDDLITQDGPYRMLYDAWVSATTV